MRKAGFAGLFLCSDFKMRRKGRTGTVPLTNLRAIGHPKHRHFLPDFLEARDVACLSPSGRAEAG